MATIRNTIDTQFTSRGARGVQQDTENVGRAQTRMGQASAGAGRSFAAQSQGLGGLVGAYAGAAATVFALEAAFTALAKAAQAETIVKGTSALAAGIAQSGPRIIASLQEITQGQLTLAEAAQNANIGLSAGFDSTQIEGLTKVAMGASRALGRNLTDSLQRVFRGVAKLEPELLDELGIFVRIEPAVNAYARELGVAAKSLSQFERGQAFANAAIEEGTRKFGMIDVSAPSAQKSLEQLNTQVMELALEFGQLLTQILLPFVNFLKNDAGNALVLFGGIILLVFSKALTGIGAFASGGITKFTVFADTFIANTASMRAAIEALNVSQQRYMATLGKGGLTGMTGAAPLGSSARAGQLNAMQFRADTIDKTGRFDSVAGRKAGAAGASTTAMRTAATKARNDFIAGNLKTKQSVEAASAALTRMNATLKSNSMASQQATAIITALAGATTQMGRAATVAAGGVSLLRKGVIGLGIVASGIMSVVSGLFLVLSVAELAGANIFGRIKDAFVDSSQAAANFESAVTGAFTATAGGAGELTTALKGMGASDEDLENLSATMLAENQKLLDEFKRQKNMISRQTGSAESIVATEAATKRAAMDSASQMALAGLDVSQQTYGTADIDQKLSAELTRLEGLKAQLPGLNAPQIVETETQATIDYIKAIQALGGAEAYRTSIVDTLVDSVKLKTIAEEAYNDALAAVTASGEQATTEDRIRLEILKLASETYKDLHESILPVIGSLGRLTGIRMDELTKMFMGLESEISASAESLKIFGIEIPKILNQDTGEMVYNFESLSKETRELAESSVIVSNAVRDANKAFDAGATSSDKLSSVIAGANAQFLNSKANIAAYAQEILESSRGLFGYTIDQDEATEQAEKFFDVLKSRVRDLIKLRDELKKVEATYKGLVKTFKKEKTFAETLRFSGAILDEPSDANSKEASRRRKIAAKQSQDLLAEQSRLSKLEGETRKSYNITNIAGFTAQLEELNNLRDVEREKIEQVDSLLARSADEQKTQQMRLLGDILKNSNAYEVAATKVKKYEDALDAAAKAGSTYDEAPIGAPNATEIKMAEALNEAQQVGLGTLLEQGIAVAETNDKFLDQYELAQLIHTAQMANLNIQMKQAEIAAAQAAFATSNASIQGVIESKNIGMSEIKNTISFKELKLEEKIMDIKHEAAMIDAKGAAGAREAHLARMGELKSEYGMQLASFKLYNIEKTPFMQFDKIKKARVGIIEMERDALKANHKLRMAAIKAQAGAGVAAAKAEIKVIKEQIADAKSQFMKVDYAFRGQKELLRVNNTLDGLNPLTGNKLTKLDQTIGIRNPEGKAISDIGQEAQAFGFIDRTKDRDDLDRFNPANENQKIRNFRRQIFLQEQKLLEDKIAHDLAMKTAAKELSDLQDTRVKAQRAVDAKKLVIERAAEDAQFAFLDAFVVSIKGFKDYVTIFAEAINANLVAEGKDPLDLPSAAQQTNAENVVKDAMSRIETFIANRASNRALEDSNLAGVQAQEDAIFAKKSTMLQTEIEALQAIVDGNDRLAAQRLSNFDNEMFIETEKDRLAIKALEQQLALAERTAASGGAEAQFALAEAQQQYINQMAALGITIKKAKDELGKFDTDMGAISEVLDTELIDGFQYLGDVLLGVNEDTRSFATGIENTFKKLMRSLIQEIQMQMITKPLAGMASDFLGGVITAGLTGGLSSTPIPFSNAAAQAGGLYAGGGVVHMSQGGQVNALRDRVPAMLEPGEFVIRKNSAKSIGRNKLGQMNATGGSGMGNVEFNIVNQGSPKQAEQQGMPKFDTDKLVIDVVMRDLENNGPIRKALRSG